MSRPSRRSHARRSSARAALPALLLIGLMAFLARPALATDWVLVMVEQRGCVWCARWHADVGPAYPLTPEGRFAPLRSVDLRDLPDDLTFAARPVYTPTFVLVADGVEQARIEGYPGADFFWGLLGRALEQAAPGWIDAAPPPSAADG